MSRSQQNIDHSVGRYCFFPTFLWTRRTGSKRQPFFLGSCLEFAISDRSGRAPGVASGDLVIRHPGRLIFLISRFIASVGPLLSLVRG
jgi:hypothetical protein